MSCNYINIKLLKNIFTNGSKANQIKKYYYNSLDVRKKAFTAITVFLLL